MKTELELEAEKYAGEILNGDFHPNWSNDFKQNVAKGAYEDFIAGATSAYVEKQKLEFAIQQLQSLEPSDYDVDYGSTDLRHFRNELRKKRINLQQKLKQLSDTD